MLYTNIIPDGSNSIQTHSDVVQDMVCSLWSPVAITSSHDPTLHTLLFCFESETLQQQKLYAVHLTISKNVLNKIIGIVYSH